MDPKDKKLLYLLDLNAKAKDSELARQLKTSKQVINYRIKRLVDNGIINKFQTILNLKKLGINIYANIYFKLRNISKIKEQRIITYLNKNNHVGYIGLLGGRFDLSTVIVAKNIEQLETKINKLVTRYPNELSNYIISLRIIGVKFPKKYLTEDKKSYREIKPKKIFVKEERIIKIDELDKNILKSLSENARTPVLEISSNLNEPFSTTRVRIKSLEKKEIISGYSTLLDLGKIGLQNYKIFIKTRDKSEESYHKLFSYASTHKNIIWFFKTLGDHDYELRIEVENQEKYQEIIRELRTEFSEIIDEVETVIVFKELKEDYSVILLEV